MFAQAVSTIPMSDPDRIKKVLKHYNAPFYVVNKSTRSLYRVGTDKFLSSVHDPFTGLQVKLNRSQTYVGSQDLVGSVFHNVFLDEEGLPCNDMGTRYNLKPKSLSIWNNAVIESIFQPELH